MHFKDRLSNSAMTALDTLAKPSTPVLIEGGGRSLTDVEVDRVRADIEQHGAVLLRGFETDIDKFAALGSRLCTSASYNESPNRELLHEEGAVQTVNLGSDPFPLHPELSREPWRPDLAMFGCIEPPEVGGQTNICDGIAIARNLPPEVRAQLEKGTLFYIRPASPEVLEFWLGTRSPSDELLANPPSSCPYWFRRRQDRVLRGFTRPALEPTLFQNEGAFVNFILFARDYMRMQRFPLMDGKLIPDELVDQIRSVARSQTYSHSWQQNDVVLLDNSRFMHGRKAIANPEGRRIATYFGYLKGVTRPGIEPDNPIWRRETFVPPDLPDDN